MKGGKKSKKKFDPDALYTKRPIIEFTPLCFILNQTNVDIFVKSIQDFIDSKLLDRVHFITYNFVPLSVIDIYFIRAIEQLLDNAIYDNNGLLVTFIFQHEVDEHSLIADLQKMIQEKVKRAIEEKQIQKNTITIKIDERRITGK